MLADDTVSAEPTARSCATQRGFLVRDLGSTNGTLLDGAEIREAYLHAGQHAQRGQGSS